MIRERVREAPITLLLAVGMIFVHVADPPLTTGTYLVLSPWMHADFGHIVQNLAVFLIAGVWTERRMSWLLYLVFVGFAAYFSLYIPVAFEYGGLSEGASGLTKALVAHGGIVQLFAFVERLESMDVELREIVEAVLHLGMLLVIAGYCLVTIARFTYYQPRPEGMAVGAHFTGLVIGCLWFVYRASGAEVVSSLENTKAGYSRGCDHPSSSDSDSR